MALSALHRCRKDGPARSQGGTPRRARRHPLGAAHAFLLALGAVALAACGAVPTLETPTIVSTPAYKEPVPGWMAAAPADTLEHGPWWSLFGDTTLDLLARQVSVSNQNVAAAAAAVAQSQALVRAQRASLLPTVSISGSGSRSGGSASEAASGNRLGLALGASWEPDVGGGLGAAATAAQARATAGAADLAAVRLSAQASFVINYLALRATEAEIALLQTTIAGYRRALQIAQNRYAAAIAPRSDVLQAETQLANAQAEFSALAQQRAQLAHALAVLIGRVPAELELPHNDKSVAGVEVVIPVGVPSELLQRRPDIAAAERRVAAANADIGIARSAYFPSLTLSANGGPGGTRLADVLNASTTTWSFGLAMVETLFDAGARGARVDAAREAWNLAVAQYRQTVLSAFQEVEDQLTAANALAQQEALRRAAAMAAVQTETQTMNRYQQGQVGYAEVVSAQISALNARRTQLQIAAARQTAAVSLITALGGGWQTRVLANDSAAPQSLTQSTK